MNSKHTMTEIERTRIIAILRGPTDGPETEIGEVLVEVGITVMEVSLVSADALGAILRLAKRLQGRAEIGAGTVMSAEQVKAAADAGASFIVSPNIDRAVIAETLALNLSSFPGAYTPTEVVEAIRSGAHAVKLFPAISLGVPYLRALRAPMPNVRLIPTGGVDASNLAEYIRAGAWAAGIGSELVPSAGSIDMDNLRTRAYRLIAARDGANAG